MLKRCFTFCRIYRPLLPERLMTGIQSDSKAGGTPLVQAKQFPGLHRLSLTFVKRVAASAPLPPATEAAAGTGDPAERTQLHCPAPVLIADCDTVSLSGTASVCGRGLLLRAPRPFPPDNAIPVCSRADARAQREACWTSRTGRVFHLPNGHERIAPDMAL